MPNENVLGESRRPRKRVAKGPKRPAYLASGDMDRMMIMFVALMGEVAALRDRLDTHEALAGAERLGRTDEVEAYEVTDERLALRDARRLGMVRRVLRVLTEEREDHGEAVAAAADKSAGL